MRYRERIKRVYHSGRGEGMIAYLPELYPDELVYSWFCRYYVHSGCFTYKMALRELYRKKSDTPSKEFLGNLRPEAIEQIERVYPLEDLVLDHTMFPQYARFIPLKQKRTALHSIIYDTCDIHHLFCVLPRAEDEQYLRYCPLCVNEDRDMYGETYWHRTHQIRNMGICTKHGCRLIDSDVLVKSESDYTFCPAEYHVHEHRAVMENNLSAVQFAQYINTVFGSPVDLSKDIPISAVLYHGMRQTKYLKPSGRSRYTRQLADDMNGFYREMGLHSISSMCQVQRVLLEGRSDFSIVCQIAFFLGMKPEELASPSLTTEQVMQEDSTHYMRDMVPVDWEQMDIDTAPILEQLAGDIYNGNASAAGRPERVSERCVYRELNLLGHQLENMPRCKAVFEKYTESYPESWARKIIWAYKRLEEKGDPFYWSDIRRLSGVKKKNFVSIIPYLEKHTDVDTAHRIMTLVEKEYV